MVIVENGKKIAASVCCRGTSSRRQKDFVVAPPPSRRLFAWTRNPVSSSRQRVDKQINLASDRNGGYARAFSPGSPVVPGKSSSPAYPTASAFLPSPLQKTRKTRVNAPDLPPRTYRSTRPPDQSIERLQYPAKGLSQSLWGEAGVDRRQDWSATTSRAGISRSTQLGEVGLRTLGACCSHFYSHAGEWARLFCLPRVVRETFWQLRLLLATCAAVAQSDPSAWDDED